MYKLNLFDNGKKLINEMFGKKPVILTVIPHANVINCTYLLVRWAQSIKQSDLQVL